MTVRIVSNWDGKQWDNHGALEPVAEPGQGCQYCGDPGKTPTAVVYGQPMRDVITVVDSAGCRVCGGCVKPAVWLAMTEWDSRRAVRVVPIKAA